jgi:hypothetical protein
LYLAFGASKAVYFLKIEQKQTNFVELAKEHFHDSSTYCRLKKPSKNCYGYDGGARLDDDNDVNRDSNHITDLR